MRRQTAAPLGLRPALAALLLVWGCNAQAPSQTSVATTSQIDVATAREVVGLAGTQLEERLGAPTYKQDYGSGISGWGYTVEDCPIEYQLRSGVVGAFQVRLEKGCHPTFRGIEGLEGAKAGPTTVFSDLTSRLKGDWRSICLQDCVDPSPPTISYYVGKRERPSGLEIIIDAQTSAADAATASTAWQQALEAELKAPHGAKIPVASYACGLGAQTEAGRAMERVRVQTISVGSGLNPGLNRCPTTTP